MATEKLRTRCCIVGGGPAGVVLGYLLARNGVRVTVLEKHADFFRDFRGDTVHPSTLEVLHQLGLLERFLKLPHQRLHSAGIIVGGHRFQVANFRSLRTQCRFVALMPQWDFLNFFSEEGRKFESFDLKMQHQAVDLLRNNGRVRGVLVRTPEGETEIEADLVIGCDGRQSTIRTAAKLQVEELGVPIDVLWFRLTRQGNDPEQLLGNLNFGKALILINRGDYFQSALVIPKDSFNKVKAEGLHAFQSGLAAIAPFLSTRVHEVDDWEKVKLLSVQINRLKRWSLPGLLCIGDAAHAMSPVGGVGINLAIQDAVATANILSQALLEEGGNVDSLLPLVQRRRELATRVIQRFQTTAHAGLKKVFSVPGPMQPPWQMKLVLHTPGLHCAAAHAIGLGVRPEHVMLNATNPRKPGLLGSGLALAVSGLLSLAGCLLIRRRTPVPRLQTRQV